MAQGLRIRNGGRVRHNGGMSDSSPGPAKGAPAIDAEAHPTRVAIVGAGAVGSTFAFSLLLSGLAA